MKWSRSIIVLACGLALAVVVLWVWQIGPFRPDYEQTNDAYVHGDITILSSKIQERIVEVRVQDFQSVKEGDLLVRLDDSDLNARMQQSIARANSLEASLERIRRQKEQQAEQIREAAAKLEAAQAEEHKASIDLKRQQGLPPGAAAPTDLDAFQAQYIQAQAGSKGAQAVLEASRHQISVFDAEIAELQAQIRAAEADMAQIKILLSETRIVAPRAGILGQRTVQIGQLVQPGTQVFTLVPMKPVWIIANFKETQMTKMRVGQLATISVDMFPGSNLKGHVESLSPASGAQFSVIKPDNATGNFTKIVQRFPVRIAVDEKDPLAKGIRPGMSVVVHVHVNK